jgi:L-iditol 2-dehydrogenase
MLHGPGDLRVEEIAEPAGEVVVRVEAATTCATDVKCLCHGHLILGPYPARFGHETAGRREDTGERVLVGDSVACGNCPPCAAGRAQLCERMTWVLGGFAERIAAPAAALHSVPGDLDPAGAAMAEPLAAAVHAVARAGAAPGADTAVLGGGTMGLMLARLLVLRGCDVTLADRHPERRAQAEAFGAAAVEQLGSHDRAEVEEALALLASGDVDWRALAGETVGLDALHGALVRPASGEARKLVVDPRL